MTMTDTEAKALALVNDAVRRGEPHVYMAAICRAVEARYAAALKARGV